MEDGANKTSIIVALLAISLIIGGIYILNQSLNKNDLQPTTQTNVASNPPKKTPTNFQECRDAGGFIIPGPPEECTFNGNTFIKDVSTSQNNQNQNNQDNQNKQNSPSDSKSDESKTSQQPTAPKNFDECVKMSGVVVNQPSGIKACTYNGVTFVQPNQSGSTTNSGNNSSQTLANNEFIALLQSANGNESKYKIVESGVPNAKWLKPGSPMTLVGVSSSFNINLQVGRKYKFKADITETNTGFLINKIESVVLVD